MACTSAISATVSEARTPGSGSARNEPQGQRSRTVLQRAPAAPEAARLVQARLDVHDVRVGIDRVGCRDRRARDEPCPVQAERIEDPLLHVAPVRRTPPARPSRRAGRRRDSSSASDGRERAPARLLERSDQLLPSREVERLPDRAGGSRWIPGEMGEQISDVAAAEVTSVEVGGERIVEPEQPVLVTQLHDRGRGEGLRDRADPVLVAGSSARRKRVGQTDRVVPEDPPVAGDRRRAFPGSRRPARPGPGVRAPARARSSSGGAVRLDQDLGDLGPGELGGRQLAVREHLAHLRPRQEDVVVAGVRAGLRRAIWPHALHQNECSKNIGSMSSSWGSNSSKISCAS